MCCQDEEESVPKQIGKVKHLLEPLYVTFFDLASLFCSAWKKHREFAADDFALYR